MQLKTLDFAFKADTVEDEGIFEGYASTFGNIDQGGDTVVRGAFKDGLAEAAAAGRHIPMLWQHDRHEPIGIWLDISEDKKGLKVRGQLLIEDPLAKRAHVLLKNGALGGMSIGYRIPVGGAVADPKQFGVSRLLKIDLREISLVTMPMDLSAKVTTVKAILDGGALPTVREFEEFLRDAGFSKALATAIASKATPHLRGDPEAKADDAATFLQRLLKAG
ncbi:MAG TPA: HK97 family phage prohead protease [Devosia sp.]|nr:HK97 family phage prohead protease [Devosia sp.]